MNYYKLNHSLDKNEIGSQFPQIQKMTKGYNYDSPNSVHSLSRYLFKFPDFEPDLNSFVLHRSAKLTDLLSAAVISACGLLISEKLMNLFIKFTIVPMRLYEASVIEKNKTERRYYWMHIAGYNFSEKVDYSNSTFSVDNFGTKLEDIKVESLSDLLKKENYMREKYKTRFIKIKGDRIILDYSVSKYSLFSINGFDFDYYISEELRDAIFANSCTGINLSSAPLSFSDL